MKNMLESLIVVLTSLSLSISCKPQEAISRDCDGLNYLVDALYQGTLPVVLMPDTLFFGEALSQEMGNQFCCTGKSIQRVWRKLSTPLKEADSTVRLRGVSQDTGEHLYSIDDRVDCLEITMDQSCVIRKLEIIRGSFPPPLQRE